MEVLARPLNLLTFRVSGLHLPLVPSFNQPRCYKQLLKLETLGPDMVVYHLNPSPWDVDESDLCKFKASQGYIVIV